MTAREQARLVRDREVSARELMAAHLDRIARINPQVNAIVAKLDDERCLTLADDADRALELESEFAAAHMLKALPDSLPTPLRLGPV